MPIGPLPSDPNLEQLKNQARDLQRRVRAGDAEAVALIRELHPQATPDASFRLADAQHALARGYGQPSWARLKAFVEVVTRWTRAPHRQEAADTVEDEVLRLGCLTYGADRPERRAQAAALVEANPGLAARSAHLAALLGDVEALRGHLARAPGDAKRQAGPYRWAPLLYLAYGRLGLGDPVAAATALLDAGADPDAGFLWEGMTFPPFTALTGAFGGGEQGPANQPMHPQGAELAALLLARGADPDDRQTLYNRHFEPDDTHLELLFAHGLGRGGGAWEQRLAAIAFQPIRVELEDQLRFAADRGLAHRVALLLAHGVDPDGPGAHPALRGHKALALAQAAGATEVVRLLQEAGARGPALSPAEALIVAAMAGDAAAAQAPPEVIAAARARAPGQVAAAAARGNAAAVRLLVQLGWDPSFRPRGTALHEAAWRGDREMAELLLSLGVDPTIRDTSFDAPASGWARHAGHEALADWLAEQAGEGG
ncbi:MAG: ankyrin repeat domain-containing protein [Myxococcota bacterium]